MNILELIKKVKKKYPDKYVSIDKTYNWFTSREYVTLNYRLYIDGEPSIERNTFKELVAAVEYLLSDPCPSQPQKLTCESNGIEYEYYIDPEDGSIDLCGGIPSNEYELTLAIEDCLADFERRKQLAVENEAENKALDIELKNK